MMSQHSDFANANDSCSGDFSVFSSVLIQVVQSQLFLTAVTEAGGE